MIHTEAWFQRHAIERDLRTLEEAVQRGTPGAFVQLLRLKEHLDQPMEPDSEGFTEFWMSVEKLVQGGKMRDPEAVEWLFKNDPGQYPSIPIKIVLLAPDSALPQVKFNEINYYSQEGWDHWDESDVGEQVWTLREFYNTFKDYDWDIGSPYRESAKRWALKSREHYSEIEEGSEDLGEVGTSVVEQSIVRFPNEKDYLIQWLYEVWTLR